MTGSRLAWVVAGIFVIGVVALRVSIGEGTKFSPDFRANSKNPYGSKLFVSWLTDHYGRTVIQNKSRLADMNDSLRNAQALVLVSDYLNMDSASVDSMLAMVRNGKTVVLCLSSFTVDLLQRLGLESRYMWNSTYRITKAFDDTPVTDESVAPGIRETLQPYTEEVYDSTTEQMIQVTVDSGYQWKSICGFESSSSSSIAAYTLIGNGKLILCTAPPLFSNYGMLYDSLWKATMLVVAHIPEGTVVWDEYYKPESVQNSNAVTAALKDKPGLTLAYSLLLGTTLLYLLISGRRLQRPVPTLTPAVNTTLDFLDTITSLYWLRRNNAAIVANMAQQVRKIVAFRIGINVHNSKERVVQQVAASTGCDKHVVERLVNLMQQAVPERVTDEELDRIHADIETLTSHLNHRL